ncbi:hypothetical protein KMP13_03515 [Epibacterium ulvae]|uniref:hypothetical protein n=1 Tax=Epibacterium ulvae TaxID=1156985 RepID=UPI001BFC482B|nr:hypothetical protein [Epibacterium ulvae]MBT8152970.1 hypothetical protein [Epibacterium ulvae]
MSLQPVGRLVKADKKGILPRIGRPPHLDWSSVLQEVTSKLQQEFANGAFSVVVRGSVARGASADEAADLDLVILTDGRPSGGKAHPANLLRSQTMPTLSIEVSCVDYKALQTESRWAWMQFMLAHNGHTFFGPDRLARLPEPRLGPHCYAHLAHADRWLNDWPIYWEEDKDYTAICQWLMKRIVRSLFESQIMRINAFSRDIYPCTLVAMEAFPGLRSTIYHAAELAINPTTDRHIIEKVVRVLTELLLLKQAEFTV